MPARGGVPLSRIHPHLGDNNGSGSFGKLLPFSWDLLTDRGVQGLVSRDPARAVTRVESPRALARNLRVIDLSGAWRLVDAAHRAVYKFKDEGSAVATEVQAKAVYGMPELHQAQIAGASIVANPGCYSTSVDSRGTPAGRRRTRKDLGRTALLPTPRAASVARAKLPRRRRTSCTRPTISLPIASFSHRHTGELLEQIRTARRSDYFHAASAADSHAAFCRRSMCSSASRRRATRSYKPTAHSLPKQPRWFVFTSPRCRKIQYSVRTNYADIGFELSSDGRDALSSSAVSTTC